jgi:predicted AAA+ superfamily ATPase
MTLVERFLQKPRRSSFLFGPRGTGKTTWLRQVFGDVPTLDLLDAETYRSYVARPERLREWLAAQGRPAWVVIDEVQRVPALLDVVHQIMEQKTGVQFIMTGSSARKLRRAGVNLLAGRASVLTLHPFMAAELGDAFDLDAALAYGLVPVVHGAEERREALAAYIGVYLEQEVKAEALVRNVGDFSRFIESVSFSHGASLNVAEVARECQINRNTARGYVSMLEDLLLGFTVPVFARRAKRILVGHPKFYYFDAGVFRSARPRGPLDRAEEIAGAALEGLVAQHLRAWLAYQRGGEARLFYWRTKSGSEVDFVVYGEDVFTAIEVKNARQVHRQDVRALRAFREDYPEAEVCLTYRGRERLVVDGVPCIPCDEFLRSLDPRWGKVIGKK